MSAAIIGAEPQPVKSRIMVVDDNPEMLGYLEQMLVQNGNEVIVFTSGASALRLAEESAPDLILLDVSMPDMDGFQVCAGLKRNPLLKEIPVIFMSGIDTTDVKLKAFQAGGVDYITKPFQFEEIQARVGVHLNLRSLQQMLEFQRQMERKVRELSEAQQATIFAIAKLAEQRDEDTGAHLERVQEYCRFLAVQLGKDSPYSAQITPEFIECIQHASPLHDIGKVAIPDSILLKPNKLTTLEFEVMKTHTVIGGENMQEVFNHYSGNTFIGMGIEIALYHHERWDGTGYPDRMAGKNIPLSARIMALADFYDALRSDRCYRKGLSHAEVRAMILEGDGTHFDPVLVRAFLSIEDQFQHVQDTF